MTAVQTPTSAYGRPLLQVARELHKHLATMHRWRERGISDPDGIRHHCHMTRVGGRWYVRDEDLAAFFRALAGNAATATPDQSRSHSAERASRELDALGIR